MTKNLTLDDDVAARLERAHRERGRNVHELANDLLRRSLNRFETSEPTERIEGPRRQPYRIKPFASGRCFLESLDDTAEVLAWAEGEEFR